MLLLCEIMVNLFIALAGILVLLSVFWALPCLIVLIWDEFIAPKQPVNARHRSGVGSEDEYIVKLTMAFRDGRNGVRSHRRVARG